MLAARATAPCARAPLRAAARASRGALATAVPSGVHRRAVIAAAAPQRASAASHHPSRRVGAASAARGALSGGGTRVVRIAALAGDAGTLADDDDAPAAWLSDDDDAEECAAAFEVSEQALRSLCHGNVPPPPCTHEYWRARGWRARPRDWERWAGTAWESKDAWPPACVADDDGRDAAAAAGSERARAAHAHAHAQGS